MNGTMNTCVPVISIEPHFSYLLFITNHRKRNGLNRSFRVVLWVDPGVAVVLAGALGCRDCPKRPHSHGWEFRAVGQVPCFHPWDCLSFFVVWWLVPRRNRPANRGETQRHFMTWFWKSHITRRLLFTRSVPIQGEQNRFHPLTGKGARACCK